MAKRENADLTSELWTMPKKGEIEAVVIITYLLYIKKITKNESCNL